MAVKRTWGWMSIQGWGLRQRVVISEEKLSGPAPSLSLESAVDTTAGFALDAWSQDAYLWDSWRLLLRPKGETDGLVVSACLLPTVRHGRIRAGEGFVMERNPVRHIPARHHPFRTVYVVFALLFALWIPGAVWGGAEFVRGDQGSDSITADDFLPSRRGFKMSQGVLWEYMGIAWYLLTDRLNLADL